MTNDVISYGAEEYGARVTSNIIEELLEREGVTDAENSILIMGTSTEGSLRKVFPMSKEYDPRRTFGEVTYGSAGFETSIIKAYDEINLMIGDADLRGMRIGDARKASCSFYEKPVSDGYGGWLTPYASMLFEAPKEGAKYNQITIDWKDTETSGEIGVVDSLVITLPAAVLPIGIQQDVVFTFSNLDPNGGTTLDNTNSLPRIADAIINANIKVGTETIRLSEYLVPSVQLIEEVETIPIVAGTREYALENTKVWRIVKAVEETTVEDEITGGGVLLTLNYTPIKDFVTATVSKWWRYPKDAEILNANPNNYTQDTITLACANTPLWPTGLANIVVEEIKGRRGSDNPVEVIPVAQYTVNADGTVQFVTTAGSFFEGGFAPGDMAWSTYKYVVNYVEAFKRSNLKVGNPSSFFVYGSQVIFGAGQALDLIAEYSTEIVYEIGSEIALGKAPSDGSNDPDLAAGMFQGVIYFPGKLPESSITITYQREPGFPAVRGFAFDQSPYNFTALGEQIGSMEDGTNGNEYSTLADTDAKRRYKEALIRGYQAIDNYPFKAIIPVGAYLDDYYIGYDYETGVYGTEIPVNFHTDLSSVIRRKSRLVKECVGYLATRPPAANGAIGTLSPEDEFNWIDRHVRIDQEDTSRPANIINGINDFRLVVCAGTPVGVTTASQGNPYIMNPAAVYIGAKEATPLTRAMTGKIIARGGGDYSPIQHLLIPVTSIDAVGAFTRARYTAFVTDAKGNIYIADAPTLAVSNSNLARQYVLDVVLLAVNLCRDVADTYIGQPYRTHVMAAMRRNMATALGRLVPDILIDFTIDVVAVPDGFISGRTRVNLGLVTAVEIRHVDIETQVKLGLG